MDNLVGAYEKRESELKALFDCDEGSSIAYRVDVNLVRINNKSKADYYFYVSNNPKDEKIRYINRPIDSNVSHTFTHHGIANEVDKIIKRDKIPFTPIIVPVPTAKNPDPALFTTACLDVLLKKFNLKDNKDYVVSIQNGKQTLFKYSANLVTWIITAILEDKDIVVNIKRNS